MGSFPESCNDPNLPLTFECVDDIFKCDYSIQSYHAVLILWYRLYLKAVLTFQSVNEIRKSDHSI